MSKPHIYKRHGFWLCGGRLTGTSLHFWASTYTGVGRCPRTAWNDYCYRNTMAHRAVHPWN